MINIQYVENYLNWFITLRLFRKKYNNLELNWYFILMSLSATLPREKEKEKKPPLIV